MQLRELKGFRWPRTEELRKRATERVLTSSELLALKSRSFYPPIQMLELTRGGDETNKRQIVTDLYNILRYLDTIEDADPKKLDVQSKVGLIEDFCYVIDQVTRRDPADPIDDLARGDLSELTEILKQGVISPDERIFVEHFARAAATRDGVLHRIKANATTDIKEAIYACTASMATGMKRFLTEGQIDTIPKLEEYCGYVAGNVGVALNRIIEHSDGEKLDDKGAKRFGLSLQMINVLKNIGEDWKDRKVIYVPKDILGKISNEELFNGESNHGRVVRESALAQMISHNKVNLRESADYIASIPESLTGYQAFTLVPFLAAVETLRAIETGGPEVVFSEKEGPKMSTQALGNILQFTYSLVRESGRRTSQFMGFYKDAQERGDHDKYCFNPERFEKWVPDLFENGNHH